MSSWPSSPSHATPTLPEPSSRAVVLDTDVASRSFKGLRPLRLAARLAGRQPLLTFVTIGELTQWATLRRWGPRNRGMLDTWLSEKPVIPGAKASPCSGRVVRRGHPPHLFYRELHVCFWAD
jgi:hypothetical protein